MISHKKILKAFATMGIALFAFVVLIYLYMYLNLPDVETLKNIQLQVPLRVYTSDHRLIAQYGEKRRSPVRVEDVPKPLIDAILATEDQRYYEHKGVDIIGLARAFVAVTVSGRKSQGASTITMQVARNFFLTRKKTFSRKINEILLAIKIDAKFSKQKILELYLNKIYLGNRAYGVAAASYVYFGKPLNQLTLAEMAMIAGLPQAPSRDNPISNPEAAKERRNHVLSRMLKNGTITQASYDEAVAAPMTARYHDTEMEIYAPYVGEMVREAMFNAYGEKAYTNGFRVYTTINSKYQLAANRVITAGLDEMDKQRGYRGAIANYGTPSPEVLATWEQNLANIELINDMKAVAVVNVNESTATVMDHTGKREQLNLAGVEWAQMRIDDKYLGPKPTAVTDVLKLGDVIRIRTNSKGALELAQVPEVESALVAMSPKNGAVLALVGGYSFNKSHFNRVTQAQRQPGSSFKPFIYAAALAKGYTLASVINDAPVVTEDSGENELWRPHNSNEKFYGPTRLREALVFSRNLVTIRLLQAIGINYSLNYFNGFGFNTSSFPRSLSLALGTAQISPLQLNTGYAIFANGGYKVMPYYIDTIEQDTNDSVYKEHPLTVCTECSTDQPAPTDILPSPRVISPEVAYLINDALQDVILRGTGKRAKVLNRADLAGKTGTTNNEVDVWFAGYNPDIATTVWVGFDEPKTLHAYAADTALPMWINFMSEALKNIPIRTIETPANIVHVKIDPKTGLIAGPEQKDSIFEVFSEQYAPTEHAKNSAEGAEAQLY